MKCVCNNNHHLPTCARANNSNCVSGLELELCDRLGQGPAGRRVQVRKRVQVLEVKGHCSVGCKQTVMVRARQLPPTNKGCQLKQRTRNVLEQHFCTHCRLTSVFAAAMCCSSSSSSLLMCSRRPRMRSATSTATHNRSVSVRSSQVTCEQVHKQGATV